MLVLAVLFCFLQFCKTPQQPESVQDCPATIWLHGRKSLPLAGKSPEHFKGALATFMKIILGGFFVCFFGLFFFLIFKTEIYCCSNRALLAFAG